MQPKKSFAVINYDICNPKSCNPDEGKCLAAQACSHKVIKQIDGIFEEPMIFQDMCACKNIQGFRLTWKQMKRAKDMHCSYSIKTDNCYLKNKKIKILEK